MIYECHITIDPIIPHAECGTLHDLCDKYKFKVANLFKATGQRNDKDQFMTGHDVDYANMLRRMISLCADLKRNGFVLRRYKIEEILLDSRLGDQEGLL